MFFLQILFVHFVFGLMFDEVQADDLVDEVDAQPTVLLEGVEEEEAEEGGPA